MAKIDYYTLGIKQQYTFDQLVVGPHNQMAAAASLQVSKTLGQSYNPLFLFGPSGVGKTHLMQAVAHAVVENDPKKTIQYISAERFISEVISAISDDAVMGVRQHYSRLDLFMLDDVQYLMESKATQSEFLHIFNNLHQDNRQIILAADRAPNQLTAFDKTIRSRLEWGLAADIKVPDLSTRMEILRLKQNSLGLNLSDEVLRFVGELLDSNVRELEGFLKRIHAYKSFSYQELNMELIKQAIQEILPEGGKKFSQVEGAPLVIISQGEPGAKPKVASDLQAVIKEAPPHNGTTASPQAHPPPPAPPPEKVPVEPPAAPAPRVPAQKEAREESKEKKSPELPVAPPPVPVEPAAVNPVANPAVVNPPAASPPPAPPPPFKRAPMIPPVYEPEKVAPPPPPPPAIVPPVIVDDFSDSEELPSGHKEVCAVFFYPATFEQHLNTVHQKFQEVIKKHKLKFRLKKVNNQSYEFKGKIAFNDFVEVCKTNKVPVAIVIGPPPDAPTSEQEFFDLLSVTLDVQGISLQLISWGEIDKDYRYLNLALDIALVRTK